MSKPLITTGNRAAKVPDPSPKQPSGRVTQERPGGHGPVSGSKGTPSKPPTPGK